MIQKILALALASAGLPVLAATHGQAQQCTPLTVVGTDQTSITKTVSPAAPLALPGIRTNWNTDWVVSGDINYDEFQARITTDEGITDLNVDMYLKYPDQTSDLVYNPGEVIIAPGEPLTLRAASRSDLSPYQVNLRVGDTDSEGTTYTATVHGCR
ncbi:MAG: hypothetical protein HC922_06245 [Leptolyngbyaceae cyanobacterium SM2_3_12]|nr:hypothetical protein [Leptolyngbyaceae cyanobacterium SM2_3_12]